MLVSVTFSWGQVDTLRLHIGFKGKGPHPQETQDQGRLSPYAEYAECVEPQVPGGGPQNEGC